MNPVVINILAYCFGWQGHHVKCGKRSFLGVLAAFKRILWSVRGSVRIYFITYDFPLFESLTQLKLEKKSVK